MDDSKQLFSFSQPLSFKLIANHGEKAFYALVLICFLYTYQDLKGQFLIDVIILVIVLFIILIIVGMLLSKVIWRFDVDFHTKNITFYLCRTASPIYVHFLKIDKIKVNGIIIFSIEDRKVFYSTSEYVEVLKILKKVKSITWGKMCDLLGPAKSIREIVNRD